LNWKPLRKKTQFARDILSAKKDLKLFYSLNFEHISMFH